MQFYPTGGLGNLLFQHHAAYARARDRNLPIFTVAEYQTAPDRPCIGHYRKLFRHVNFVDSLPPPDFVEDARDLSWCSIPVEARCLQGYFQSWKYFKKYQKELRDLLRVNEEDKWAIAQRKYKALKDHRRTVCLHIRLGDNLDNPVHCLQPESYYETAMKRFPGQKFIAFSDSPDIATKFKFMKEYDVVLVSEDDPVMAFFMMSLCDDFIIPNSTLSLMAWHMRENTDDAAIHYTTNWHKNGAYVTNMEDMVGVKHTMRDMLLDHGVPFDNGKIVIPGWVNSVKIDVGLRYDAPHMQNWLAQNQNCMVFGFEANKRATDYMFATPEERQKININDYFMPTPSYWSCLDYSLIGKRCWVLPVALDLVKEPEPKTFYIIPKSDKAGEDCCSLMRPQNDFCANPDICQVMAYSLADFLKLLPDGTIIDYIKTDVQGKDLDVIKSAGDYIKQVVYITTEENSNQYENSENNTFLLVNKYLASKNFIPVRHSNTQDYTFLNTKFLYKASDTYIWQRG